MIYKTCKDSELASKRPELSTQKKPQFKNIVFGFEDMINWKTSNKT